jgi:hypothetical protein
VLFYRFAKILSTFTKLDKNAFFSFSLSKMFLMVIVVADHESDIRIVIFDRLTKILPTFTKLDKKWNFLFFLT